MVTKDPGMSVIAIYNVFDGEELLEGSINQVKGWCDYVIAFYQTVSNQGNIYHGGAKECKRLSDLGLIDLSIKFDPNLSKPAMVNERNKRNEGVRMARSLGATHFINLDCDEYWEEMPEIDCAHKMWTYFKKPYYRYDTPESYYVPGIITLTDRMRLGNWDCGFHCDPTRKPNHKLKEGKAMMHHFSYVRKDMDRKIQNSTAKDNILSRQKDLIKDLENVRDGYRMSFIQKIINLVPNIFQIDYENT